MDKNKIAWLWLIRDHQPVSVETLIEKLTSGEIRLPVELDAFRHPSYLARSALYEINGLIDAGLVATENNQPLNLLTRLTKTAVLDRVQDIFSISLTQSLRYDDQTLMINPLFGKPDSPGKWAQIFVAMPFKADLYPVYNDHILKVMQKLSLSCKRGDDFFTTNHIMSDVWSAIYHAKLCIVDCTERNPNVFYELGIAHTLGRKTVLITQTMDDIPFDVRSYRIIEYQYTPPGMAKFEETLTRTLQTELNLI